MWGSAVDDRKFEKPLGGRTSALTSIRSWVIADMPNLTTLRSQERFVAHSQRKFANDDFYRSDAAKEPVRAVQTAPTIKHIPSLPADVEAPEERPPGYYTKRLALAGGTSAVAISFVAGTPLAALAVLGFTIAVKKGLFAFGNYVLDNTL
jgi:hypothetical protein